MCRGVVVGTIRLLVTAGFAVGEEGAIWLCFFTNPHSPYLTVVAVNVAS